jgi:hypothetical protein
VNGRAPLALGIVIALLLGLDGVALATRDSQHVRALPPVLANVVPQLERFVERTRGLRYKQPVDVELVDQQEMTEARHREADLGGLSGPLVPTGEADGGALLGVLGLINGPLDLDSAIDEAEDDGVVGVYFPRQRRLLVVGDGATPFVRSVLVHELTHALDDQHFHLGKGVGVSDDEASLAYLALVEGDATSVEERYLKSLSVDEYKGAMAERAHVGGGGISRTPSAILNLLAFPYVAGATFVESIRSRRGNAAIDAAFAHPPTTSEHILRPESFLAHEAPRVVAKPVPRGEVVGRGVLGVMQLALMLDPTLDEPTLRATLDEWAGDRFVAWTDGAHTCLAANIATDTVAGARRLTEALRGWVAAHPSGTVQDTGRGVALERCA